MFVQGQFKPGYGMHHHDFLLQDVPRSRNTGRERCLLFVESNGDTDDYRDLN